MSSVYVSKLENIESMGWQVKYVSFGCQTSGQWHLHFEPAYSQQAYIYEQMDRQPSLPTMVWTKVGVEGPRKRGWSLAEGQQPRSTQTIGLPELVIIDLKSQTEVDYNLSDLTAMVLVRERD